MALSKRVRVFLLALFLFFDVATAIRVKPDCSFDFTRDFVRPMQNIWLGPRSGDETQKLCRTIAGEIESVFMRFNGPECSKNAEVQHIKESLVKEVEKLKENCKQV